MKKIVLVCLLICSSCIYANKELFPDEQVQQFILIQNNAEKCFQPKLWHAKTEEERNRILNSYSEMEIINKSQYEIALMTELFGHDVTVQTFETPIVTKQFNEKLSRLFTNETTVNTPKECDILSQYFFQIRQKHIFH